MAMSGWVKVGGVWRPVRPPFVKVAGSWRPVNRGFVKVAGAWRQWFTESDPITVTFWANTWGRTYANAAGASGGPNRATLAYWGYGWNNQTETSMLGFNDPAGLEAALAARPYILSGVVKHWVGHVYSGTQPVHYGWHNQRTQPASFSRLHTETDAAWDVPGTFPKPPGGAGTEHTFTMPAAVLRTLEAQIPAGNIGGLTLTDQSATANPRWGWSSATNASTTNSGGSSGGLQSIQNTTDTRSARIELLIDLAPPAGAGFV